MFNLKKEKPEDEAAELDTAAAAPKVEKVKRRSSARRKASNKGEAFVAFIGDDGAILLYVRGNKVLRRLFAPSAIPEHMQSITDLMEKHSNVPLYVMLDTIDQQYVRQTFPPVSALSVAKLVNRRLQRDFPKEDIKGAISLGREKGGRREWSYLLISLANNESLQSWMGVFLEMPNECKGLYLTAVEGQQYAAEVMREAMPQTNTPWQLLVSHNKVGGVRQVVLHNGKLTFTRLTQSADENNPELTAGNIEQEVQNTIDYLRRLNFENNQDMSLLAIVGQEVGEHLDLPRFGLGAAAKITPFDAATLLNIEQAALSGDRYGDAIMGAAFATSKKRMLPLFTPYAQKLSYVYKGRLAGKILAAIIVAYALFSAGESLLNWLNLSQEESVIADDLKTQRAQLNQAQESIGTLDADTSLWSSVVKLYEVYEPTKYMPLPFVMKLAEQLDEDTRLTKIDWAAPYEIVPAQNRRGRGRRVQNNAPEESVSIEIQVEFDGGYETQDEYIAAVNAFYALLKQGVADYQIEAKNLPGRKDPNKEEIIRFTDNKPQPFDPKNNKVTFIFKGSIKKEDSPGGTS